MDTSEIGLRVRNLRQQLKMTQATFAEKLGVRQREISKIETGKFPPHNVMDGLAARFGLDLHWLLTGQGETYRRDAAADTLKVAEEPAEYKPALSGGRMRGRDKIPLLRSAGD